MINYEIRHQSLSMLESQAEIFALVATDRRSEAKRRKDL